jgi:hypothetical protein
MTTENVIGAENQQERLSEDKPLNIPLETGYYLAGFVDGEGSFNVSLRQKPDYHLRWQVVLSFNVSQRDITNLIALKETLNCGIIKKRADGVYSLDVTKPLDVIKKVIPFFQQFSFRSKKAQVNFAIFCKIALLMSEGKHRTKEGLKQIVLIRETLNKGRGRTRKYSASDVLDSFLKESSETTRQDPVETPDMI